MAIKGKTKRSQGRPVRRPATAPRLQAADRRLPWYRATAFPVTLAVVALVGTLIAASARVQEGRARNDVRRFTVALQGPLASLPTITGAGSAAKPGFTSAADLAAGKLKPADLAKRAQGWESQLSDMRTAVSNLTLGTPPAGTSQDGMPSNAVGGHVPLLSPIREAYAEAIGFYGQAAHSYELAGDAPVKSPLAGQLVSQGDTDASRAQAALDAAAAQLALLTGRYHLDVTKQLPGESASGYASRYSKAPTPTGTGTVGG